MRELVSQQEMHERAMLAFRKRIDIGLGNGIASSLLEPPNPFQPEERRRPKRGFVLFLLMSVLIVGTFVYFSVLS
ncbi:MAG: hypothetical protein L0387_11650 [Acidobacteria bacterium]|nr:hypothetical protein [Acidobacteriota bacterium]